VSSILINSNYKHSRLCIELINPRRPFYHVLDEYHFSPFLISHFEYVHYIFTTKHFLEVDNEVIVLSNDWIWY
jgi:hypothetical protein